MKKLLFLIPAVLLIPVLFFGLPRIIKIKTIACQSQYGPCSQYLEEHVRSAEGKDLAEAKKELQDIFANQLRVADFSIRYNLPDKLLVYVLERKAVVAVQEMGTTGYRLLDKEAKEIGTTSETNLPVLIVLAQPPDLSFVVGLFYELTQAYDVRNGTLRAGVLEVPVLQTKVLFPLEGDVDVLLGSLRVILSRDKIFPREIDLRFKNAVLRF